MPRNGAGVFSLPAGYLATSGQTATAAQHNDPLEDLESDMNTARPIVAGGTGATTAAAARTSLGITGIIDDISDGTTAIAPNLTEGSWQVGSTAVTATAAELNILDGVTATTAELNKTDGLTGNILTDGQTATLTKGYDVTSYDAGTQSSGTFTPDPANGNLQYTTNGGSHTLARPSTDCTLSILYTNNGSAGAIATTAFDKVTGTFTTTDGDKFMCHITRINGNTTLFIDPLQ